MADEADKVCGLIAETMVPIVERLQRQVSEAAQRENVSADRLRTLQDRTLRLEDRLTAADGDYEAKGKRETVVELWPETGENKSRFLDRCETALSKCIGPDKARRVCRVKWARSEKLGKKEIGRVAFVARGLDAEDATEVCGSTCVGCKGADAPFDPDRET